ncbi:hypothetical protein AMTR_s00090p00157990 [Amborella trichopoda]|uniref:Uncharacterized protein n=1 Tax=Amborella trichopoda TaxID=13333 RepID=W1P2B1_AMBTC|nr:hypothetical protein AMTR_s00090p00157990 [Amborella trichopoda]
MPMAAIEKSNDEEAHVKEMDESSMVKHEPDREEVVNALPLQMIPASFEHQEEQQANVCIMLKGMRVRAKESTQNIIDTMQALQSLKRPPQKKKEIGRSLGEIS